MCIVSITRPEPRVYQPDPPGLIHDDPRLLPPWRGSSHFYGRFLFLHGAELSVPRVAGRRLRRRWRCALARRLCTLASLSTNPPFGTVVPRSQPRTVSGWLASPESTRRVRRVCWRCWRTPACAPSWTGWPRPPVFEWCTPATCRRSAAKVGPRRLPSYSIRGRRLAAKDGLCRVAIT